MRRMRIIIVHGGAWNIPEEDKESHRNSLKEALAAGWSALKGNGRALDAVEEAVVHMENSGVFHAGSGASLNSEQKVELDAAIMTGDLNLGAVAGVSCIKNPISLARYVMENSKHALIVGTGAQIFAKQQGIPLCDPDELVTARERRRFKEGLENEFGTVGAVALDGNGNMAVATSTSGTYKKMAGRVGDSPLVGCGTYADKERGACSATGHGESFMKTVAAKTACDALEKEPDAQTAAEKTLQMILKRTGGKGGFILLRKDGDYGIAFTTPAMARGVMKEGMEAPEVSV
ncbi:isoaspartyl peptidase/L-asparaginase [Candidatus Micrarchaeota archaeon]|nr:isoaspartyl peptidase/L-asparaginase [Candidatus Micrarchaeota archaeon]